MTASGRSLRVAVVGGGAGRPAGGWRPAVPHRRAGMARRAGLGAARRARLRWSTAAHDRHGPAVPGVVVLATPGAPCGGLALRIEGARWLVGAVGYGERPPRDVPGYEALLRSLPRGRTGASSPGAPAGLRPRPRSTAGPASWPVSPSTGHAAPTRHAATTGRWCGSTTSRGPCWCLPTPGWSPRSCAPASPGTGRWVRDAGSSPGRTRRLRPAEAREMVSPSYGGGLRAGPAWSQARRPGRRRCKPSWQWGWSFSSTGWARSSTSR